MPSKVQDIIQRWNPGIEKYIKVKCECIYTCEHFEETKGILKHKYTGYCVGREIFFQKGYSRKCVRDIT